MWGTGRNEYGQQGRGDYGIKYVFTEIDSNFSDIAGGWKHTLIIKSDNTMWGAGENYYGTIGITEHPEYTDLFTSLEGDDWRQVDTWSYQDLAVKQNATYSVFGCGDNRYGQLGQDDYNGDQYDNFRYKLEEIELSNIDLQHSLWLSNAVCGHQHIAVLDTNGHIFTSGYNYYGQLGLGDHGSGTNRWTPTQISSDVYNFIAAGSWATMAIDEDGSLLVCGRNSVNQAGQLGLNDTNDRDELTKITQVQSPIGNVISVPAGTWTQVSIGN